MNILIVEDEFVGRTLLQDILSQYGTCYIVVNGREALTAFEDALNEKRPYDLICLDIMLPELDGQQTLKAIRELECKRGIGGSDLVKIIMTTGLGDSKNIMDSFMKGACDAYVVKPIKVDNFLMVLRKLGLIAT